MQTIKHDLQTQFLETVCREQSALTVFLMNGFQLRGVLAGYDDDSVVVMSDGKQNMIYKHAISTISPAVPVNLDDEAD